MQSLECEIADQDKEIARLRMFKQNEKDIDELRDNLLHQYDQML